MTKSEDKTRTYGSTQGIRHRASKTKRHQAPDGKTTPTRRSALALTLGVLFVEAQERIKAAPEALEDSFFREHVTNLLGNIAKEELYSGRLAQAAYTSAASGDPDRYGRHLLPRP